MLVRDRHYVQVATGCFSDVLCDQLNTLLGARILVMNTAVDEHVNRFTVLIPKRQEQAVPESRVVHANRDPRFGCLHGRSIQVVIGRHHITSSPAKERWSMAKGSTPSSSSISPLPAVSLWKYVLRGSLK